MMTNGSTVEELLRISDESDRKDIDSYFIILLEELHPNTRLIPIQNLLFRSLRDWYFYCLNVLIL